MATWWATLDGQDAVTVTALDWWTARERAVQAFIEQGRRDFLGPLQPGSERLLVARSLDNPGHEPRTRKKAVKR